MSGIFGVASREDCVFDLFYGVDYHSHLGTKRGGLAVYDDSEDGFHRSIHNIENTPFRTKFEYDIEHFRLVIDKDDSVASISRVYRSAVFYENEMKELFGLQVTHMKLDLHDKLYRIDTKTPFAPKEDK